MISPAVFMFHSPTPEEWEIINKSQAEESNQKYFGKVEEELPKALESCGLFNVFKIPTFSIGCSFLISYKKYPNVWAEFNHTKEDSKCMVEFQCYINKDKMVKFNFDLINFLVMIGFKKPSIKKLHWIDRICHELCFTTLFFKPEYCEPILSKEKFEQIIERWIEIQKYELEPYKLHYEQDGLSLDVTREEADKIFKKNYLHFYNEIENNEIKIKSTKIVPDDIQKMLINLFMY